VAIDESPVSVMKPAPAAQAQTLNSRLRSFM
jgi:hypothetical protein